MRNRNRKDLPFYEKKSKLKFGEPLPTRDRSPSFSNSRTIRGFDLRKIFF